MNRIRASRLHTEISEVMRDIALTGEGYIITVPNTINSPRYPPEQATIDAAVILPYHEYEAMVKQLIALKEEIEDLKERIRFDYQPINRDDI